MPNVYLDASLFACPAHSAEPGMFGEYLSRLVDLNDLRQSNVASLVISARTPELLATTESYPYWERLPDAVFPQRGDVQRIIDAFLNKTSKAEEVVRVDDLLLENQACTPDTHLTGRHPALVEHHHHMLALMSLEPLVSPSMRCEPLMITTGTQPGGGPLEASGSVVMIQYLEGAVQIPLPHPYRKVFGTCGCADDTVARLDPVRVLVHEGDYQTAIKLSLCAGRRGVGTAIPPYKLGAGFEQSARRCGFDGTEGKARSFLRACTETILDENLAATHALREGPEATKPPRVRARDGARGMRRDIDYEYHLHYWRTSAGPELVSAATHNDFSIAD